jgi:hypothetical protein
METVTLEPIAHYEDCCSEHRMTRINMTGVVDPDGHMPELLSQHFSGASSADIKDMVIIITPETKRNTFVGCDFFKCTFIFFSGTSAGSGVFDGCRFFEPVFVERDMSYEQYRNRPPLPQRIRGKNGHVEVAVMYPMMFNVGDVLEHVKSGESYTVATLPDNNILEATGEPAYGYVMSDGRICNRCQSEMEDGRFVFLRRSPFTMVGCSFDNTPCSIEVRVTEVPKLIDISKPKRELTKRPRASYDDQHLPGE